MGLLPVSPPYMGTAVLPRFSSKKYCAPLFPPTPIRHSKRKSKFRNFCTVIKSPPLPLGRPLLLGFTRQPSAMCQPREGNPAILSPPPPAFFRPSKSTFQPAANSSAL